MRANLSERNYARIYEKVRRGGVASPEDLAKLIPPMGGGAGELWGQISTIGKEVTPGTAVATTRKMYGMTKLTRTRATNLIKVNSGTRDNQRDAKVRAVQAGGTFDASISAEELLELLAITLRSGVTSTVYPGAAPAQPTGTASGTGSPLGAGVVTYAVSYKGANGESAISPTQTTTVTAGQSIAVTSAAIPAWANGINVYTGPAVGTATPLTFLGTSATTAFTINALPAVGAAAAPTAAQQWVYTPNSASSTVDTVTWEWFDGARNWQQRGVLCDELKLNGVVSGDTKLTATLFGREMIANAATAPPAERLPDFIEGWEVQLFLDAFGGVPGTTLIPGELINWDVDIKNNAQRKYFGDNTTATGAVVLGELGIQSTFTLEASTADALAEYNYRDANTKRLARIQLGNNRSIGGGQNGTNKKVMIDLPGAWTAIDLTPEDAGTKVYKFTQDYVYDPTNAYGIQISVVNGRTTLYSGT